MLLPAKFKPKITKQGKEVRDKLYEGVRKLTEIVGSTLGHCGRNVVIEYNGRAMPTNDGVTIARLLLLEDEIENLGASAIAESSIKTNEMVGDGTTSTVVLTKAIIDEVRDRMEKVKNPLTGEVDIDLFEYSRLIKKSCNNVVEMLKKSARPIRNKAELEKVSIISMQDETLGKVVADMVDKVGIDGYISVEENFEKKYTTDHEVVQGMKFLSTYISPYLATNPAKREAVYEDSPILILNSDFESLKELIGLVKFIQEVLKTQRVVIIAKSFGKELIAPIVATTLKGLFKILAINGASLTTEQLEDIAVYVGGNVIDTQKGMALDKITPEDFGKAQKVAVNKDDTIIMGGAGTKADIKARIQDLLKQMEDVEQTEMFKNKIKQRIASLSSGVGVIRVGAKTDVERDYLKFKVEDAVSATKAAKEEGIVKGGGMALKDISDKLPEGDILKKAITAPYETIKKNAGGKLKVGKDILDPVKVVRVALENACSLAGTFVTIDSAICDDRHDVENQLKNVGFLKEESWEKDYE